MISGLSFIECSFIGNMAQVEEKEVRLWLYCRDLGFTASLGSSKQGSSRSTGAPKALKHWAVVVDFMSDRNPERVNKRVLYEANKVGDLLVATEVQHGEDEENDWKAKAGFVKKDLGMAKANETRNKNYCEAFNEEKIEYVATKDNCQKFANDFLASVFPDSTICLPASFEAAAKEAKPWFSSVSSASSISLSNLGLAALVKKIMVSTIENGTFGPIIKEAISSVNFNGIGKGSLLAQDAIKNFMVQEGKQLILSASGEMIENLMSATRGAFTWWNLLQIPVELVVGKLMKCAGFTDLEAYGGKKVASFLTAAGVGLIVGGPFGLLGSVAFWIGAEVVATLIRCLLAKFYPKYFDGSDTVKLIKSIYRFFKVKVESGLHIGLDRMLEYMESTQKRGKKLA